MSEPGAAGPSGKVTEEAAAWFARMRGPDAEANRPAFETWLAESADHRASYNRAAEIFAMGKLLADDPVRPAPPRRKRTRFLATALVGAAAFGTIIYLGDQPRAPYPLTPAATSAQRIDATGDRSVRLTDGSMVRLAAGSSIALRFDAGQRLIDLLRGRARFDVFHEPRPFIVQAAGGSVTARGTLFEVALTDGGTVSVALIRGAIDVALPSADAAPRVQRLNAGDTIRFEGATTRPSQDRARTVPATGIGPPAGDANLTGLREYDAVPLGEIVAEANRGSARPIRLGDAGLAARRLSGRFAVGDTRILAERLAILFDLSVDLRDASQIVLRPRTK